MADRVCGTADRGADRADAADVICGTVDCGTGTLEDMCDVVCGTAVLEDVESCGMGPARCGCVVRKLEPGVGVFIMDESVGIVSSALILLLRVDLTGVVWRGSLSPTPALRWAQGRFGSANANVRCSATR